MINITIVGAGSYGSKIAEKYQKFSDVSIKAVVSHSRPKSAPLSEISLVSSATEWKKKFKIPGENDVFDICVHQNILVDVLKDFVKIGAKNFILPKPIALNKKNWKRCRILHPVSA